jgi:hypothetical protein
VNKEIWGRAFKNGTFTGALNLTVTGRVNLTFGYFVRHAQRDRYVEASHSYYQSKIVWAVPPGREYSPYKKLTIPFESDVWLSTGLVLMISITVISILNRQPRQIRDFVIGRNIRNPVLNLFNIAFGGALHRTPHRNFARFLLASYLLYCLVLRSSYQGKLFNHLQTDLRYPPFGTTKELLDNGFIFYCYPSTKFIVEPLISDDNR